MHFIKSHKGLILVAVVVLTVLVGLYLYGSGSEVPASRDDIIGTP